MSGAWSRTSCCSSRRRACRTDRGADERLAPRLLLRDEMDVGAGGGRRGRQLPAGPRQSRHMSPRVASSNSGVRRVIAGRRRCSCESTFTPAARACCRPAQPATAASSAAESVARRQRRPPRTPPADRMARHRGSREWPGPARRPTRRSPRTRSPGQARARADRRHPGQPMPPAAPVARVGHRGQRRRQRRGDRQITVGQVGDILRRDRPYPPSHLHRPGDAATTTCRDPGVNDRPCATQATLSALTSALLRVPSSPPTSCPPSTRRRPGGSRTNDRLHH